MSDALDLLAALLQQPPPAPAQQLPPPPPPRVPAGRVTPVMRTELPDVTDPAYLGGMVTSSNVTEADIEHAVQSALMAQAAQDDLIEEGGRLIGLRVVESRPLRPEGIPHA